MNCEQSRELLPLAVYGDVPTDVSKQLSVHLGSCADCRNAMAGIEQVRTALIETEAPAVHVDVSRFHAAPIVRGVSGMWRLATMVMAASLMFVLFSKAEFRVDGNQFSVRWGLPAAPPQSQQVATMPRELDERLNALHDLTIALAGDMAKRDDARRYEYGELAQRLNQVQQNAFDRVTSAERDVAALYTLTRGKKD